MNIIVWLSFALTNIVRPIKKNQKKYFPKVSRAFTCNRTHLITAWPFTLHYLTFHSSNFMSIQSLIPFTVPTR